MLENLRRFLRLLGTLLLVDPCFYPPSPPDTHSPFLVQKPWPVFYSIILPHCGQHQSLSDHCRETYYPSLVAFHEKWKRPEEKMSYTFQLLPNHYTIDTLFPWSWAGEESNYWKSEGFGSRLIWRPTLRKMQFPSKSSDTIKLLPISKIEPGLIPESCFLS